MGVMSLAEVMDNSIEVLKKYLKVIITFNFAYGALSIIGMIGFIIVGGIFSAMSVALHLNVVIIGFGFFIFTISIIAFVTNFKIGLIKISSQEISQEPIYASQAISASFKKIFVVLGVILMEILLYLPVAGIFGAIGYMFFDEIQQFYLLHGIIYDKNDEIGIMILIIGFVLLMILSVFAYVTIFSFAFHAVAIENKGVFAALKRSYNLVKRNYFKILGCIILFNLTSSAIIYSLQSFLGLLGGIIYMILKFLNVQQDFFEFATMVYNFSSWPINILSWLVITPIGTIMLTYLYYNQRFKKEGYDITLNLNKLQKDKEKEQLSEGTEYNNSIKPRI
ncbi:hypothetical protein [Clostridium sp.]|jgi:hypothetical protein|uniref:hypothetical protein n=1 Tax=Clostridium sp. TaxID=1506 RepID=UPI003EEEEF88